MATQTKNTTRRPAHGPTFDALVAAFAEAGFRPGAPHHLSTQSTRIDRLIVARSACPRCRRRGLEYRPFRSDDGRYRVLGRCSGCGAGEEF